MLVLTRKKEEGIVLGDSIKVYVLGISDGKVKLGIDAPSDVVVLRTEVYEKVERSNREALRTSGSIDSLKKEFGKLKK